MAEARGLPMDGKGAHLEITKVPLVGVTDAKDTHDRVNSDTGFGSQKSLMFTIANLRQNLRRPQTALRWTATANMFIDAGKGHIHRALVDARPHCSGASHVQALVLKPG